MNAGSALVPTRRQFLGWSAAAMAGIVLAGCADRPGAAGSGDPKTVTIVHPAKVPLILWAVSYLAEDKGFYKDEGVTVERVLLDGGPPALAAMLSGSGNAGLASPGEMLAAVAKGQKFKALMAYTNSLPAIFMVSADLAKQAGVTSESNVEDRRAALGVLDRGRYGITVPGSQTDALTRMALKQAGVDPDSGAQIVPLQNGPNCLAALANGQIDGFVAQSPAGEQAAAQNGAVALLLNALGDIEGGDALQGYTLHAPTDEVEANTDTYAAMVRADLRALRTLVEEPDASRDLLRKTRFSDLAEDLWPQAWGHVQVSWASPFVTKESLQAWFTAGLVSGVSSDADFPYDEVVDMSLVDAGLEEIGWTPPAAGG